MEVANRPVNTVRNPFIEWMHVFNRSPSGAILSLTAWIAFAEFAIIALMRSDRYFTLALLHLDSHVCQTWDIFFIFKLCYAYDQLELE